MRAKRTTWVRAGVALMAVQAGFAGVWALFAPRSFWADFPGFGSGWVSAAGRYNEHLVRDVGGLFIAFAILFLWAAVKLDRVILKVTMIAWLPFGVAHFIFHATHRGRLSKGDFVVQLVALAALVVLPLALLVGGRRRRGADFKWARSV